MSDRLESVLGMVTATLVLVISAIALITIPDPASAQAVYLPYSDANNECVSNVCITTTHICCLEDPGTE